MTRPAPRRGAVALLAGLALVTGAAAAPPASAEGPEQVVNGDFSDGLTGWTAYPSPSVVDGQGCIDVPAGTGAYSAAITQRLPVVEGETYALRFTGSISPEQSSAIRAVVQAGPEQDYAQALPEKALALTPTASAFSYTFTSAYDIPDAELAFQQTTTNAAAYRLCVDDVSLTGGAEPEVYRPDTGPRVRVNQVGYLPLGPKQATLVTDETTPVRWRLEDADGRTVRVGRSTPRGVDPSAGLNVHTISFTGFERSGTGYVLVADGETSHPFDLGTQAYERLRVDTKTFFYTNRSGTPISDEIAPGYGREAGHVGEAPNQGDTAVPCQDLDDDSQALYDEPWTCEGTHDVSGGWYDAGDHGKYVVNGGIAVAQLMQEYERTRTAATADRGALGDGTLRVPETGNGVPDLLDEARWELEWLLKMQVPQGRPLAGMAFHKVADVDWTGLPLAPADDPQRRVLYRPSTAATLNLAAAAAQGARLFRPFDAAFADELLAAAETAYDAAQAHPDLYAPAPDPAVDPNPGSGPYDDTEVGDEFYWAAAELFLTTRDREYRRAVLASPEHTADVFPEGGFDWGRTAALGRLDLATVPNRLRDRDRVQRSVVAAAQAYLDDSARQPVRPGVRPRGRPVRLGLEQLDPQQHAGHRDRVRPDGPRALPRRRRAEHRLPARPQRAEHLLRHRLRRGLQPQPAQPLVRALPRPRPAAPAGRAPSRAGRTPPRPAAATRSPGRCWRGAPRSSATSTTSARGRPTRSPSTGTRRCRGCRASSPTRTAAGAPARSRPRQAASRRALLRRRPHWRYEDRPCGAAPCSVAQPGAALRCAITPARAAEVPEACGSARTPRRRLGSCAESSRPSGSGTGGSREALVRRRRAACPRSPALGRASSW